MLLSESVITSFEDNRRKTKLFQTVFRGLRTLGRWYAVSQQRRQLSNLPQERLKDIGLTPEQVRKEVSLWFWQ